jgi:hypothetical protein
MNRKGIMGFLKNTWVKIKKYTKGSSTHVIVSLVLVTPILVYVRTFGESLSTVHGRWAEMGSAMSGIYGPILAVLGFWILSVQLRIQQQTTKHMFDEARLRSMDADAVFYLARLEAALNEESQDGRTVASRLITLMKYASVEDLRQPDRIATAKLISQEHSRVHPAWRSIHAIFSALGMVDEQPYRTLLSTTQQRAMVVLSYEMCVTLDNFVWCSFDERWEGPYLFSAEVRTAQASASVSGGR